ncbi:ABC transporter ATP-binding protein [Desulfurobacterium atlanticum]|uniref:ATP-binding cassette, subfamily B, MsbA n=1 Tax=Desulfurobacterium atlanticum TaxID=240169 RepID=A0A238YHM2_9BACT|nr:ABC transporter ATP-binding protein [Desulfurobacterium atlanticum]SNR69889.1 ATP-binding cassette, subfamily B, MsbA [Desulfurobacterium atlanticum]
MRKDIKFLLLILKKDWKLVALAIFGSILESIGLAGLAYIVKNVVDDVFIAKSYEKLVVVVSILLLLAVSKQIGFFLKNYIYPLVIFKAVKDLRKKMHEKIINAEPSFLRKISPGDLISRATTDLEKFAEISSTIGTNIITETFTVIGVIIVLIYRDWRMFLIFTIIIPFLSLALDFLGNKRKKYSQKQQESFSDYIQHLNQIISGFEVVKLFKKTIFFKVFERINETLFERQKKSKFYETVYLSTTEILAYAATGGIIFYGGIRIIKGEITPGDFFSFLGGVLIIINSMQILQRGIINLKALSPVIERIQFILNIPEEKAEGADFNGLKDKIEYKNVNVIIGNNHILKDINFTVRKGEKIGIVGLTGSGKSTLVKILPGLVKEYAGEVLIDGTELKKYSLPSIRNRIGMISQEVFIFNDTLRNNLLVAKPDATDEELIEALKKAKANFVFKLEHGLDTVLGEKGSRLSGGERQRIAIARIFLKNPDILIIDEATSALDVETEEYVMEEIKNHFKDKTILMITHRLKTLKIANRIIVMENGKIVEEGTKDELIAKKGAFYKFCTISETEN